MMIERKVHKPHCYDCPFLMRYNDSVPKKVKGAFLKYGYRYCTCGKRIREFKPRDPKVYIPSWCPRKKSPAELRIYCYKNDNVWFLQFLLGAEGISQGPLESDYAVRYEGHTELSASAFHEMTDERSPSDVLGIKVHDKEVIEINDGIVPYYFYLAKPIVVLSISFDGEKSRKNHLGKKPDESEM